MKSFAARRIRQSALLIVLVAVLVSLHALSFLTLHRAAALTGWALMALVVGLALYNVRKRFPFLPLGSAATWLQLHIYAGLLSGVIFFLHINWRMPNGVFEIMLAILYLSVFASGLLGLWMSRTFSRRLTTRGEQVLFERIGRVLFRIRAQVERLVLDCLRETESTAIPEFYLERLKWFFARPRHFIAHLFQSNRFRRRLLTEINTQGRYLNDKEKQVIDQIAAHVMAKDDLDYQYTHQAALKMWLFAHVPLTYALLVFAVFHVMLVYAFSGGIR